MHHRSKLVLAMGALLLATPALSSCGFNLATDHINTVQHGGTNRDSSVDVLSAVIVAGSDGSGTLVGRVVNNDGEATELTAVTGASDTDITASEVEAVEIPSGEAVAVDELGDGVRVEGDFEAGDIVPLTFEFANGERVEVEVPIVRECGYYVGLDAAPSAGGEGKPNESASGSASESAGESADEPSTEPTDEAGQVDEESEASSCETQVEEGH